MIMPVPRPFISRLNFFGIWGVLKKRRKKGSVEKGKNGLATSWLWVTSMCTTAGIVCFAT